MSHAVPRTDAQLEKAARRRVRFPLWNILLFVPLIATLVPAWYNSRTPELGGIPFFYWYQMLCIPLSVLCLVIVYRFTRRER
jgi:uncharacterized membrane protein YhdT